MTNARRSYGSRTGSRLPYRARYRRRNRANRAQQCCAPTGVARQSPHRFLRVAEAKNGVLRELNRYNMGPMEESTMDFPALFKSVAAALVLGAGTFAGAVSANAQTIRVDVTAAKAVAFDPDLAL